MATMDAQQFGVLQRQLGQYFTQMLGYAQRTAHAAEAMARKLDFYRGTHMNLEEA